MLTDHPSSSTFPVPGHRSSSLDGDTQASLSPDTSGRIPRCFPAESHGHSRVSWVFPRQASRGHPIQMPFSEALSLVGASAWPRWLDLEWWIQQRLKSTPSLARQRPLLPVSTNQVQWLPLRWPEWRWTEGSSRCSQQTHTIPLGLPDLFSFLPGQWITLRRSVISGIVLPDTIMLKDGVGYGQT